MWLCGMILLCSGGARVWLYVGKEMLYPEGCAVLLRGTELSFSVRCKVLCTEEQL